MRLPIFLPTEHNYRSIVCDDETYTEVVLKLAMEYSDFMEYDCNQETVLATAMFIRLVEKGFFMVNYVDEGDQVRTELRAWSPIECCYKLPQDFTGEELGIAEGLQEYFTGVN